MLLGLTRAGLLLLIPLALLQDGDRPGFRSDRKNFKVSFPPSWRRLRPPNELIDLAVSSMGQSIFVSAFETEATIESMVADYKQEQEMTAESIQEVSRRELEVAGARAMEIRFRMKHSGLQFNAWLTVFTHQGIAYRIIGTQVIGDAAGFQRIYEGFLESFSFLADRKEWLERFQGKPARTALLGGRASLELNRPRWTETTFEAEHKYGFVDFAQFEILTKGAWVTIRVNRTALSAEVELAKLQELLCSFYKEPKVERVTHKSPSGDIPYVYVQGESKGHPFVSRGAVFVREGMLYQVWADALESQRNLIRADWQQILSGFEFHPDETPAFSVPAPYRESPEDPALASFLPKGRRILTPEDGRMIAVSPDGTKALVQGRLGPAVVRLSDRSREPLPIEPSIAYSGPAAWLPDGTWLAYRSGTQLVVTFPGPESPKTFDCNAACLAFGPGPGELTVCTERRDTVDKGGIATNRLAILRLDDGSLREPAPFPLNRFDLAAYSPDGSTLAVVSNRRIARTWTAGGNVETLAVDGWTAKEVTQGVESIASLSWSGDGKRLYAVAARSAGGTVESLAGAPSDLLRVSIETGESKNLTRCGRISRAWWTPAGILLEIETWEVSAEQRGVFLIPEEALEASASLLPEPPPHDPDGQRRILEAKVREAMGATPLKSFVPTSRRLEEIARKFAEGVETAFQRRLDFSPESLDRLDVFGSLTTRGDESGRLILLGLGAYYGETLRRTARAEWALQEVPFGDWAAAGRGEQGNPFVEPVLPFSSIYRAALNSEEDELYGSDELGRRDAGPKMLLIYPPAHARAAILGATPPEYPRAVERLDRGEIEEAIAVLKELVKRHPSNVPLARRAISICEAAGMEERAARLTREAIEAGNEVPEILMRHSAALLKDDPAAAIPLLRKAAAGNWPPAQALIDLGIAYDAIGRRPVAESCWRYAARTAGPHEIERIRELMGIPKGDPKDEDD
jgi:tetratricopeptide (TPR) repeat protein